MKVGDFVRRKYATGYRYGIILYDIFLDKNYRNRGKAFRVQWTCGKRSPCLVKQLEVVNENR